MWGSRQTLRVGYVNTMGWWRVVPSILEWAAPGMYTQLYTGFRIAAQPCSLNGHGNTGLDLQVDARHCIVDSLPWKYCCVVKSGLPMRLLHPPSS